MPKTQVLPIRGFKGINRRDGGDLISNQQFYRANGFYQALRGLWYRTPGTTHDLQAADLSGANKVTGVHRHYNPNGEKCTIYHCEPNSSAFQNNTADLTLAEINGGDLFDGGAVEEMRFCYTALAYGIESGYNSANRVGFVAGTNAWLNAGHQSITVSANTKGVRITAPTFESSWRAINVFAARGNDTEMVYIGTIYSSGGHIDFKHFIGPAAANADAFGTIGVAASNGGSLLPGTYFVALGWLADSGIDEAGNGGDYITLSAPVSIQLKGSETSINVTHSLAASSNGAKATYVFIGYKSSREAPMLCVGIMKSSETFSITTIPDNSNAQSHPALEAGSTTHPAYFVHWVRIGWGGDRHGFLLKKNSLGTVSMIFSSRSLYEMAYSELTTDPVTGAVAGFRIPFQGYPVTNNDKYTGVQPFDYEATIYDPNFAYFNGSSYFGNGYQPLFQTDGKTLGNIVRAYDGSALTRLPPAPRFVGVFENTLITAGGEARNQLFSCNALSPFNWAAGGTGTGLRFLSIGDLFGDGVTAVGIWSMSTDAINDPRSYLVGFKKNACWMKDTFPDPSSGVGAPMEQLSGRVGTVAHRSICQTPIGLCFVGNDGNIYVIRGGGEPKPIGTVVQSLLSHLVQDDSLMRKVSAVYHDNHLKISYPSSSSSTYNDAQIWCDMRTEENQGILWSGPHLGVNVGAQIVLSGESDDGRRIGIRNDSLGTLRLDDTSTFQHLGVDFSPILEWKTTRFGAAMHHKRIMGMHFDAYYDTAYSHDLLVEMFADDEYHQVSKELSSGAGVWDTDAWNAALWGGARFFPISCMIDQNNLIGRTFTWRLTHMGNAQFILAEANILFKPERRIIHT